MGELRRFRPRAQPRQLDLLRGALDVGGWTEPVRLELNARLRDLADREPSGRRWCWVMATADRKTVAAFAHSIMSGPRAASTFAVWTVLPPFVKDDDGLLLCSQRTLAETAGIALRDVSRALQRLCDLGALQPIGDGRYRVHPTLLWHGRLAERERAEAAAPVLSLV